MLASLLEEEESCLIHHCHLRMIHIKSDVKHELSFKIFRIHDMEVEWVTEHKIENKIIINNYKPFHHFKG